jgi:uncharacterized protein (TIGR00251 family)
MIAVRDTPEGATFLVRVQPRARKNAVLGELGDALRVALQAPPVEGRANEALIRFCAEMFSVPRSAVTIASGEHGRNKRVVIAGCTATQIVTVLQPHFSIP